MVMSTVDKRIEPFGAVRSLTFTNATFSPDGRWVAYRDDRERPPGERRLRATVSGDGGLSGLTGR